MNTYVETTVKVGLDLILEHDRESFSEFLWEQVAPGSYPSGLCYFPIGVEGDSILFKVQGSPVLDRD